MRPPLLLALAGFAVGVPGVIAAPTLKTTSVKIPQGSPNFPGGDKATLVNTHCLICHSAEMVLTQPVLPKEVWTKEVNKMRKVYGAPLAEKDVPAVVDYLAELKPTR